MMDVLHIIDHARLPTTPEAFLQKMKHRGVINIPIKNQISPADNEPKYFLHNSNIECHDTTTLNMNLTCYATSTSSDKNLGRVNVVSHQGPFTESDYAETMKAVEAMIGRQQG